jgi:hypothetical protein
MTQPASSTSNGHVGTSTKGVDEGSVRGVREGEDVEERAGTVVGEMETVYDETKKGMGTSEVPPTLTLADFPSSAGRNPQPRPPFPPLPRP